MMSGTWEFIKRHKGKIIAGSVLVSGAVAYAFHSKEQSQRQRLTSLRFNEDSLKFKQLVLVLTFAASNLIFVAGDAALFNYSTSQNIQRLGFESENPCKVLVITVYNAQYPIDVHVIHQICEPHAKVLRIAIVRKSMMQALVEFESAENAKKVKHAINGADIYSGCCTLKVEFAKPEYVKVTRQDSDQWDFTL
ncbi:hypothetical protein OSTOST_12179, partial [Ostertagia ostertagi]